jgi:cell division protein FtsQ
MPLVDLDAIRAQAMTLGWVKDVRVARRYPDTIVVDVDKRIAAAIWQNRQRLSLIDADGVVLETVALDRMPDLPLVIGPAANLQAAALTRLLDSAPTIKPMFAGATWIGGRRWDVRFQSGEVLALPEGEAAAAKALAKFARMDATAALLGKGLVRFDMRIPGKIYIRMSREPGKRIEVGELRSAI